MLLFFPLIKESKLYVVDYTSFQQLKFSKKFFSAKSLSSVGILSAADPVRYLVGDVSGNCFICAYVTVFIVYIAIIKPKKLLWLGNYVSDFPFPHFVKPCFGSRRSKKTWLGQAKIMVRTNVEPASFAHSAKTVWHSGNA